MIVSALVLAVSAFGMVSPAQPDLLSQGYKVSSLLQGDSRLKIKFGLKKNNMDLMEQELLAVSMPHSQRYGKHLSHEQVTAIVQPPQADIDAAVDFLSRHGVDSTLVSHNTWLETEMTVDTASKLFDCQIASVIQQATGRQFSPIVLGGVTLPAELERVVDMVLGLPDRVSLAKPRVLLSGAPQTGSTDVTDLKTLYQIPLDYNATNSKTSQCVGEFVGSWFNPDDTELFFEDYSPINVGRTSLIEVMGTNNPDHPTPEPSLDIEYIMAMGSNVSTIFYYESFVPNFAQELIDFFQALNQLPSPPLVVSVSFGTDGEEPFSTAQAMTNEIIELQSKGVTVMFASGDNGVGCDKGIHEPDFPNSPYILMVGATDLPTGATAEISASLSSGGFSDNWAIPDYQADQVSAYLTNNAADLPPSDTWNASGRGFPDVAAVGVNLPYIVNGRTSYAGGTSFSSPIVGGILSLLNDIRLSNGKAPLGFVNPLLYQISVDHPSAFNDVDQGPPNSDPPCEGFQPASGWDPVTGLGSLNFNVLAQVILDY